MDANTEYAHRSPVRAMYKFMLTIAFAGFNLLYLEMRESSVIRPHKMAKTQGATGGGRELRKDTGALNKAP